MATEVAQECCLPVSLAGGFASMVQSGGIDKNDSANFAGAAHQAVFFNIEEDLLKLPMGKITIAALPVLVDPR